jgi:hypothetical protein
VGSSAAIADAGCWLWGGRRHEAAKLGEEEFAKQEKINVIP